MSGEEDGAMAVNKVMSTPNFSRESGDLSRAVDHRNSGFNTPKACSRIKQSHQRHEIPWSK